MPSLVKELIIMEFSNILENTKERKLTSPGWRSQNTQTPAKNIKFQCVEILNES